MANLQLKNVAKVFPGNVRALSPTTVEIQDGEFVMLVGPSGCGKSTLLRLIAGLEKVSAGEILLDGKLINYVPPKDRDIAMVFQNYALYPHMSVYENMAFGLKMRHLPQSEIDDRVRMAMDILGLTHLQDRKPKALSGGQRQRVAVGRAIVRQPKLFLFDEPLSNLDAKLRVSMRVQLIKLHKRLGTTMIYVTHDQVEAMSMGERLILLKEGVVQQVGSPLEIYDRPVNQFVASFIGSPPMNFIHCLLTERQGDLFLKGNGFQLKLPVERHAAVKKLNSGASCALVLGVRPEDISERPVSGHIDEAVLTAQVSFLEPLGSEVLATCTIPDHEIVVRLDPRTSVKSDQKVDLVLDLERATLFDPTTTKAIR